MSRTPLTDTRAPSYVIAIYPVDIDLDQGAGREAAVAVLLVWQ